MQRKMSDEVKIGASATPFQSIGKAPAIDKNTSDFDNANLKKKKDKEAHWTWNLQCKHCQIHPWHVRFSISGNDWKN